MFAEQAQSGAMEVDNPVGGPPGRDALIIMDDLGGLDDCHAPALAPGPPTPIDVRVAEWKTPRIRAANLTPCFSPDQQGTRINYVARRPTDVAGRSPLSDSESIQPQEIRELLAEYELRDRRKRAAESSVFSAAFLHGEAGCGQVRNALQQTHRRENRRGASDPIVCFIQEKPLEMRELFERIAGRRVDPGAQGSVGPFLPQNHLDRRWRSFLL